MTEDEKKTARVTSAFLQLTDAVTAISSEQRIPIYEMFTALDAVVITMVATLCKPGMEEIFLKHAMKNRAEKIRKCRAEDAAMTIFRAKADS